MAVLEPVVATLIADTTEFTAKLDEAEAKMDSVAASGAAAGDALGAGGLKSGADDAKDSVDDLGSKVGDLGDGLDDIDKQLAEGALFNLPALSPELRKLGDDAKDSGGKFSFFGNALGGLGGPLGDVGEKTNKFSEAAKGAGENSGGFLSALSDIPTPALVAGAALTAVSAVSVDLAAKYQNVTNQIAAGAGISTQAAAKIGKAFLTTAGTTTQSAQQIAEAYSGVAAQMTAVQGQALTASQALSFMKTTTDLAEGSGENLTSATSALAGVMQAYGIKVSGAAKAGGELFQSARLSGNGLAATAKAVTQLHTQLGAMTPPLGQVGGLLVDLANHGEVGSRAIRSVSSAFVSMLKNSSDLITSQSDLNTVTSELPPSLKVLAAQYTAGTVTQSQLTTATDSMTSSQYEAWTAFTSANTAVETAKTKYQELGLTLLNSKGSFVGIQSVIAQLGPKLAAMGTQQQKLAALQTIFGTSSVKLLDTIEAGPAAYAKATAEVQKHNAAAEAAKKATEGLDASFEKVKSAIEDAGIALGQKLMPYVVEAAQGLAKFAALIVKNWPQIAAAFSVLFAEVRPMVDGFIDEFKGVIEVLQGVVDFVKDVFTGQWGAAWDAIKKQFDGFVEILKGIVTGLMGDFGQEIERGLKDVVNFFAQLPSEAVSALSSLGSLLMNVGEDAMRGMWSGIQSIWNTIIGFFDGIRHDIAHYFDTAGTWLYDVGRDLIDGFIHGIESMADAVRHEIAHLGDDAVGWMKDAVGSHSPSTLFAAIGQDVVQGLANGISQSAGIAHSAITNLGKGLTTNFALGASGVGAIASGSANGGAVSATVVSQPITLTMNGQTVANTVLQIMLKNGRATSNIFGGYAGGNQSGTATKINTNAVSR